MCVTDGSLAMSWPWELVLDQIRDSFLVKSSLAVGGASRWSQADLHSGRRALGRWERQAGISQGEAGGLCGLQRSVSLWSFMTKDIRTGLPEPKRPKINTTAAGESQFLFPFFFLAGGKEELKSLLMKVKKENEKVSLKLNIQKTKIMASGPITSWEIDGETVETVSDLILLGSKITADGDCSHEIKRRLLLGKKVMTNLDSILKSEPLLCQQRSV